MIKVVVANNFWSRLIGLIGKTNLSADEGLFFPRCKRVHTYGMRFPIDVVFIDKESRVLGIVANLVPWRISPKIKSVDSCLELRGGVAARNGIVVGTKLSRELGIKNDQVGVET